MRKNTVIIIYTLVLFFTSCAIEKSTSVLSLHPQNTISQLGDSIYLSKQVSCIDTKNDTTYISDYRAGLYALDCNMKLTKKISNIGNGTGEVNRPAMIFAANNGNVILYNEGARKYSYFGNNSFLKSDSKSSRNDLSDLCRFFSIGDTIFQSIINDKFLVSTTKDGTLLNKICPLVNGLDQINNPALSERHLIKGDSTFYLIGMGLPIIQEYTFTGNEVGSFDLNSIEMLSNAYSKNKNNSPNTFYTVVKDAYYKNGRIYLLTSQYERKYKCNTIVVLHKKDNQLQHFATYMLDKNVYRTFCVNNNNECYAICANNSSIEIYKLPNE